MRQPSQRPEEDLADHQAPGVEVTEPATGGRARRRLSIAGIALTTCAVIATSVAIAVNANASTSLAPARERGSAPPATADRAPRTSPRGEVREGQRPVREDMTPVGAVIASRIKQPCGELVFWFRTLAIAELPQTPFGVTAGCRDAAGRLRALVTTNETEGAADAPGFHAIQAATGVEGQDVPLFGYYAGPAAKITADFDGETVQARQAVWDRNPAIVVFWFDPQAGGAGSDPKNFAAFDRDGQRLPTGNGSVGRG